MADVIIEQIKQRLDIIELLSEYLKLQKAGSNWRAICPFHHENSPSFMVSSEKQIWHCFGCAKGGDIFTFIQEIEGIDFVEALKLLADKAHVTLPQYNPTQQDHKQKLLHIISLAQQFYSSALQESKEGEIARQYIKQRGLSADSVAAFGLGYSYLEWGRLHDFLKQQGISEADQTAAGLLINGHDRFRGRLMIPLHDGHGTVVGFTARTLQADETGGKYINSPQSDIYDKSNVVFGLFRAKTAIKKLHATLVVEGNLDVITAQQHGFTNTVATSGTAFTEQQILQLKRYSPNLLLAFDLDLAGQAAAERGIDLAMRHGMNIKIVRWPEQYKDPDDCIRANASLFKKAIHDAIGLVDYWFIHAGSDLQLTRVEHKKVLVQRLLPKLAKLTDPVEQAHYLQQLADVVHVDVRILQEKIAKGMKSNGNVVRVTQTNQPKTKPVLDRSTRLAEYVFGITLLLPEQFGYVRDYLDPEFVTDPALHDLYIRMLDQYNKSGQFECPADTDWLNRLRLQVNVEPTADALIQGIRELHKRYIQQRLRDIEIELKDTTTGDALLEEANLLTQQLTELSR
ncbi:MAG: DNA primase [Patescibacteria group bacterium]